MMTKNLRGSLVSAGFLSCFMLSAAVLAEPRDRAARQKVAVAMTGDFAAGRYDQAEALLLGTDQACADRCSSEVRAQIWLYIGSVRGSGAGNQEAASAAFAQALELDPSFGPDHAYTNDQTYATYRAARARIGLDPEFRQSAHLPETPAATTGAAQPAGAGAPSASPQSAQAAPTSPPPSTAGSPAQSGDVRYGAGSRSIGLFDSSRPLRLGYRAGDPIPPDYHVVTHPRRGLVIAGAIVTGVFWSLGVVAAQANDFKYNTGWLVVPVLGPWLGMATLSCDSVDTDCKDARPGVSEAFAILGAGQAIGAGLFTIGLAASTKSLVRNDLAKDITVAPIRFGHSGHGLAVLGRF